MEEYAVRYSVSDVINMLETVPVSPDMVPELTIVQIMNRAPLAHLSIERALKFLINKNGGAYGPHHNLRIHLSQLRELDEQSAAFLDKAFSSATDFYGLNHNRRDLRHFKSLNIYLDNVGTADAFDKMRYWELDQSTDERLIRKISLAQIHRRGARLLLRRGWEVRVMVRTALTSMGWCRC